MQNPDFKIAVIFIVISNLYPLHFQFLQIRNKLNQEQNSKLQQQKELLNKRNMEVTLMDKRISELRERLYKKKAEARQKENLPVRLRPHSSPLHKTLFVNI